jgi:hypothetical protein
VNIEAAAASSARTCRQEAVGGARVALGAMQDSVGFFEPQQQPLRLLLCTILACCNCGCIVASLQRFSRLVHLCPCAMGHKAQQKEPR